MSEFRSQKFPKSLTFSNACNIKKTPLREGNLMSGRHYTWEESPLMYYVWMYYVLYLANNFQTSHLKFLYTQGTNLKARYNWKTKTLHLWTTCQACRFPSQFFFCFIQSSYNFTLYSELLTGPSNQQQKKKHVTKESKDVTC
jgi:hypothetical protein